MRYRPDVDGLRAVAVISVLFYHLRLVLPGGILNHISGGYIGVDVFFVISGYVITGTIFTKLQVNDFSLSDFYGRRARRILPALFVMLFLVSIIFSFNLLPTEMIDFSKSLNSTVFSISNFYFWISSGYFDAPAEVKPLLNTWSLGVEEQFYILWPLALLLLHRLRPAHLRAALILIGFLSFMLSVVGVFVWPEATFYLVFARAWELLLGGGLALGLFPRVRGSLGRNIASLAGISLIFLAVVAFSPSTPFPGAAALVPCLGASLVIAAGEAGSSLICSVLAWRPVVFIGAISYSLYLWHWPVLVLQKMTSLVPGADVAGNVVLQAEVILLSLALATLSWRLVERPFRARHWEPRVLFRYSAIGATILLTMGGVGSTGLPFRFSKEALRVASYLDYVQFHVGIDNQFHAGIDICQLDRGQQVNPAEVETCLTADPNKSNFLLLGDSHANHLYTGLVETFPEINVMRATGSGCKPMPANDLSRDHCGSLFGFLYKEFFPTHRLDGILLAGNWQERDLTKLGNFIDWANGKEIPLLLIGPIVQYNRALPRLIAEGIRYNDDRLPDRNRLDRADLDEHLAKIAKAKNVPYISLLKLLCAESSCVKMTENHIPLQFDYGHLTDSGSVYVINALKNKGQLRFLSAGALVSQ